jgi:hypothetical protein
MVHTVHAVPYGTYMHAIMVVGTYFPLLIKVMKVIMNIGFGVL